MEKVIGGKNFLAHDYSAPKEGAILARHKSGPHPDLAQRFIDFMLDGKNSAELTNRIGSGNPNLDRNKRRVLSRMWTEIKLR